MLPWQSRRADSPPELAELVVLTRGIGRNLMAIDAKLEVVVDRMDGEEDDEDPAD